MKSILIIGMGRFGHHLCENLAMLGNDVMVVDQKEEVLETGSKTGGTRPEQKRKARRLSFAAVFAPGSCAAAHRRVWSGAQRFLHGPSFLLRHADGGFVCLRQRTGRDGGGLLHRHQDVYKRQTLSDGAQAFFGYATSTAANDLIKAAGAVPGAK